MSEGAQNQKKHEMQKKWRKQKEEKDIVAVDTSETHHL